jgi:hypothetical protein
VKLSQQAVSSRGQQQAPELKQAEERRKKWKVVSSCIGSLLLGLQREIRCKFRMGVAASPNGERARLGDPLSFRVPDCKFGLRHIEAHCLGFMWLQMNARKALQRTFWRFNADVS